jgi:hypothetical protein
LGSISLPSWPLLALWGCTSAPPAWPRRTGDKQRGLSPAGMLPARQGDQHDAGHGGEHRQCGEGEDVGGHGCTAWGGFAHLLVSTHGPAAKIAMPPACAKLR